MSRDEISTSSGFSRRDVLKRAAVGGTVAWAAPAVTGIGSRAWAQAGSPPPPTGGETGIRVDKTAPLAVFTGQEFDFTITVFNAGPDPAQNVVIVDDLPDEGTFVSSTPAGAPSAGTLTLSLGTIAAGDSASATIRWRAPDAETTLTNSVVASADNAADATDAVAVAVGTNTVIRGVGVAAAGTGLRNRDNGDILISGIPAGATINRAVLVWAILYQGSTPPPGTITFNGTTVTADLTATTSGNLCWGDSATIGYAADVTALVSGNGTYAVTDPQRGTTREDSDPSPVFPVTDGASLVVFYTAAGVDNQVLSDFGYSTNTAGPLVRNFSGINSVGGPATLYLAGPDGQSNGGETITFSGSGSFSLQNTWDGSDPQEGPDFSIGNLWDTDPVDVSAVLPAGQATLDVSASGADCIGFNAAVLVVSQTP